MFAREQLDALFTELEAEYRAEPDYEQMLRDAHLGIALSDAGRPLDDRIDSRVIALIEKHRPAG